MAAQTVDLIGNQTYSDTTLTDYTVTNNDGVGNNTLTLGDGTDQITLGSGGSNTVTVGNGNDTIAAGGASNTITTGNGNSQIATAGGNNTITVGSGSNTIALGDAASSTPDIVHTASGSNTVSVSAAAISGDTIMGALTSDDGSTNQLVLTTAGTMNPVNVSGFASWQLANGGANSLTLSEGNFSRLPGGLITVIGGTSGNTINAAALSAAHSVTIDAGAGTDAFTGGAGSNRFVFAPSNLSGDTVNGGAGNNTIELTAGGSGTLSGLGTNFTNINTVVLDANAAWTIGINNPAAFTGTVFGFVAGDTFDLTNVAFDAAGKADLVSNASVTNQLQITENGTTINIDLDPSQNFAGDFFHLGGDGGTGTDVVENNTPCYCRGTMILTERGEVAVEDLAIGDKLATLSGAAKPIRWIGRRSYQGRFIVGNRAVLPIRVAAGALAEGLPARDLLVSPEHALYLDGVLVPARLLANGATITQADSVELLEYFHIELDRHDILLAEGMPAESYVDCDNRGMFHNGGEFAELYPDDRRAPWVFCAERLEEGSAELAAIGARLLARAEELGYRLTDDADLHLVVDGEIVRAQAVADGAYSFTVPAGGSAVWLASRSAVPAEVDAAGCDIRRLGVAVERIALHDADLSIEARHGDARLSEGFHEDEASHRWTGGLARLPESWLRCFPGGATLDVHLIPTDLRYRLPPPTRSIAAT